MAKRYVVQHVMPSEEELAAEAKIYIDAGHRPGVAERLRERWVELAGRYVKLGGGTTLELSEANVIGWNAARARSHSMGHRLIEVQIVACAADSSEGGA